ncbi:hypothetical protein BVRB_8g189030 [Beta vulgaris subsp. vulgaris]|nr:hypothetical protein BVRB_8g189030 [Beta vulgaris subsp. vulgaris]
MSKKKNPPISPTQYTLNPPVVGLPLPSLPPSCGALVLPMNSGRAEEQKDRLSKEGWTQFWVS